MERELEMLCEIGRSLEYRIQLYHLYTSLVPVIFPLAVVVPRITVFF